MPILQIIKIRLEILGEIRYSTDKRNNEVSGKYTFTSALYNNFNLEV